MKTIRRCFESGRMRPISRLPRPSGAGSAANRGRTCGGSCDLAKAQEYLQKALVADVTYGPAHNTLGMLYLKQRRLYLAAWARSTREGAADGGIFLSTDAGATWRNVLNRDWSLRFLRTHVAPRVPACMRARRRAVLS